MPRKIIEPCGLHCIKAIDIGVSIGGQEILKDINLHIHCGNLAAIIGRNGAGKSTLIKAILGTVAHSGRIEFTDHENGRLQKLKIGYVPQLLDIEKRTPVTVYDMIAASHSHTPVWLHKNKKLYESIREQLSVFNAEELIDRQVCNLSGGELQRVLISMAVMDEPHLLLLDEPVSGIDASGMEHFYETMDFLKKHYDLAIILVSHDLDYVRRYADQVILLDQTILAQGTARQVYRSEAFFEVFGSREGAA